MLIDFYFMLLTYAFYKIHLSYTNMTGIALYLTFNFNKFHTAKHSNLDI